MRGQELRTGNWVNLPSAGINARVDMFSKNYLYIGTLDIDLDENDNCFLLEDANGIELTKDWLLKLGFSLNEYNHYYISHTRFGVDFDIDEKYQVFIGDDMCDYTTRLIEIKYVHQLQNLYFALTGEEL